MAPKEQKSKKNQIKKQEKLIEDQTFGLKNKNKSKKVQQHVDNINRGVKNSTFGKQQAATKEAKEKQKLAKKIEEEENRMLNEGVAGTEPKKKESKESVAARLGLDPDDIDEDVAAMVQELELSDEEDSSDEDEAEPDDTEILVEYDDPLLNGDEMFYEKTIEDIIEEQRAALQAAGIKGTPVNAVTFNEWKERKKRRRQLEMEARVKAEQMKKKGGKGLSVLSGKELFNFDSNLFKDDESAVLVDEDDIVEIERKQREEREALLRRAEEARAQKEQDRLMEAQRAELEAAKHELAMRVQRARAPGAPTFEFEGVVVNAHVFAYDDMEDLLPFRSELGGVGIKKMATAVAVGTGDA